MTEARGWPDSDMDKAEGEALHLSNARGKIRANRKEPKVSRMRLEM